MLVDDSATALVRDLGAALTELTLQGRYFGQYTLTVVLYDRDPAALERSVGACLKAFAAHDAQATDERYNLLNAWLAVLPGQRRLQRAVDAPAEHQLRGPVAALRARRRAPRPTPTWDAKRWRSSTRRTARRIT